MPQLAGHHRRPGNSDERLLESIADGGRDPMHILLPPAPCAGLPLILRMVRDAAWREDLTSQFP